MVLGVHWLRNLGQIKWDFEKLVMEFHSKGNMVSLKGIPPKNSQVLKKQPCCKMLSGAP